MQKRKCLIITHGFFGDIIFASSIAKKLKEESQFDEVDYLIGFPQMERLMQNNPYINNVYVSNYPSPSPYNNSIDETVYDKIIRLESLSFQIPPPIEFQKFAGVKNVEPTYSVYTESEYDDIARKYIESISSNGKKTIAIMNNWKSKTYLFSEKQYQEGIDVPNLGYGGRHRDTDTIIKKLSETFNIVLVGMPDGISQQQTSLLENNDEKSILFECSLMKYCDSFVGTEGGLCNLAAGVGTRTIITGDFVHQLYGWNGVLKKIEEPKLGPKYYFNDVGHVTLNPYITDDMVVEQIIKILN